MLVRLFHDKISLNRIFYIAKTHESVLYINKNGNVRAISCLWTCSSWSALSLSLYFEELVLLIILQGGSNSARHKEANK